MKQGRLDGKPPCPTCGKVLNAYSDVANTGHAMRPGDYTFCLYCATPLEWNGKDYAALTKDALVLARLNWDFIVAEELARFTRDSKLK